MQCSAVAADMHSFNTKKPWQMPGRRSRETGTDHTQMVIFLKGNKQRAIPHADTHCTRKTRGLCFSLCSLIISALHVVRLRGTVPTNRTKEPHRRRAFLRRFSGFVTFVGFW